MNGFEQVQEGERRLAQMRQQITDLEAEAASLGNAIAGALAAGQDATDVRQRRAEARQLRADLLEAATLLDHQLATGREDAGKAAAEERVVAIKRAFGSLRTQLDADADGVYAAAVAYQAAVERMNGRARDLAMLAAEADALAHRFGVEKPTLAPITLPARHPKCVEANRAAQVGFADHVSVRPSIETDEHGRTRRTFMEIAQTEAFSIIKLAGGPCAWPELTERQRAILAEREQEQAKEADAMQRFAAEADRSLSRRLL